MWTSCRCINVGAKSHCFVRLSVYARPDGDRSVDCGSALSCLFVVFFNPWDSVTEKMPTKIQHEAINFCHSRGKKVGGSVDR